MAFDGRLDALPAGTTVLCPGHVTAGSTTTTCALDAPLAPTYSGFAIAAGTDWVRSSFTEAAGVEVVFYEEPGGELAPALDEAAVDAFLIWVTDLLGPYPYGDAIRVAGGPTTWLGFEHPATGGWLEVTSEYPDDLAHALDTLGAGYR